MSPTSGTIRSASLRSLLSPTPVRTPSPPPPSPPLPSPPPPFPGRPPSPPWVPLGAPLRLDGTAAESAAAAGSTVTCSYALFLDFSNALRAYATFDPNQRYVLSCEFGLQSAHLADLMRRACARAARGRQPPQ